jgi:hypothetical protein
MHTLAAFTGELNVTFRTFAVVIRGVVR